MVRNNKRNGKSIQRIATNGKERQSNKPSTVVRYTPNVFGFPSRLVTRLRYSDIFTLTSTVGAQGLQVFRWNSTFDPDFTGTGHQPLYRDTYAAVYNHYSVISAKATIRIINANAGDTFLVGCVTDDDSTFDTASTVLSEQNYGQSELLTPLSGSISDHTFVTNWDCKQVLGIDPFASESYKTTVGANPSEISFLGVWAYTTNGTTATLRAQIVLEQEVLWTELVTPTIS